MGPSVFVGKNPQDMRAYQVADKLIALANDYKSDAWKSGAAEFDALLKESIVEDDPATAENEAVWQTARNIGGAYRNSPVHFLGEVIFKEGIQELF